jgi:hypothetical protein
VHRRIKKMRPPESQEIKGQSARDLPQPDRKLSEKTN